MACACVGSHTQTHTSSSDGSDCKWRLGFVSLRASDKTQIMLNDCQRQERGEREQQRTREGGGRKEEAVEVGVEVMNQPNHTAAFESVCYCGNRSVESL